MDDDDCLRVPCVCAVCAHARRAPVSRPRVEATAFLRERDSLRPDGGPAAVTEAGSSGVEGEEEATRIEDGRRRGRSRRRTTTLRATVAHAGDDDDDDTMTATEAVFAAGISIVLLLFNRLWAGCGPCDRVLRNNRMTRGRGGVGGNDDRACCLRTVRSTMIKCTGPHWQQKFHSTQQPLS